MIGATEAGLQATGSQPSSPATDTAPGTISRQSRVGLNAANFFLAEITGVVMPFLGAYLQGRRWSETAIGVAILAGRPGRLPHANPGRHDRRPGAGSGGLCWRAR